ncbi:ATP-binding cassette domain-containing protein [Nocardia heshunensis]
MLSSVDLVVPAGQITAVLGGPGAGKSMIARALAGELPTTAQCRGKILVDGKRVGYVPQDGVTVFAPDKAVGAQLRAWEERHREWSVERACAAAYYPADALALLPHQNSGGQIQRAALAAALLAAPDLLIVDGPTNSLDAGTAYGVWKSLRELADSGVGVLAISNEVRLLITGAFADRMVLMHEGCVLAAGSTTHLLESNPIVQALFRAG